ncbi:MAG: hypothetical protein RTU30_15025 [Candidatus Thorarchaeota archaeon]
MRAVLVFDEAGIPQASVGFDIGSDSTSLFGSFLSAMQIFAKGMSGSEVQELTFAQIRLLLGKANDYHVITIHLNKDSEAEWNHSVVIDLIEERGENLDSQFLFILQELLTQKLVSLREAQIYLNELLQSNTSSEKSSSGLSD